MPGGRCSVLQRSRVSESPPVPVRPLACLGDPSLVGWGAAALGWPHSCTLSTRIKQLALLFSLVRLHPYTPRRQGCGLIFPAFACSFAHIPAMCKVFGRTTLMYIRATLCTPVHVEMTIRHKKKEIGSACKGDFALSVMLCLINSLHWGRQHGKIFIKIT